MSRTHRSLALRVCLCAGLAYHQTRPHDRLLTGRYLHNIKAAGKNDGGYCAGMHVNYSKVNDATFAKTLS